MITPNQIREKKISTVESGGYDRDEVNELLLEIIESYEAIYDENKELYRKMEVLANRIEEYRADEDSIKTALITAQKMASQVTREAKEKADKSLADSAASAQQTVVDAKEKADKIIGEAREYVAGLTKEKAEAADEIVLEAQKKANDAISSAKVVAGNALSQARKLAGEIVSKAKEEKEYHNTLVLKLREESKNFKATLVSLYEAQLDKLNSMSSQSENSAADEDAIQQIENELNEMMSNIAEVIGDDKGEASETDLQQDTEEYVEENADDTEVQNSAESGDESDAEEFAEDTAYKEETQAAEAFEGDIDEVDEIIDELESADTYSPLHEPVEEPPTEEEVSSALDAFTADEITPIDEGLNAIPEIEDEPEFESAMPFETYFNVNKDHVRTDETISLIPPEEEDDDEDDSTRFKGFFKKKK